jgi:hypothetical protein
VGSFVAAATLWAYPGEADKRKPMALAAITLRCSSADVIVASLDQRDERLPFFDDIRGELRRVAGADVRA